MEKDLIDRNEQLLEDYYKLDFDGQNVEKLPSFKKWYKKSLEEIKTKNNDNQKDEIFCISFCPNCISYTTCCHKYHYSLVKCLKCMKLFCPACKYISNEMEGHLQFSFCLKGYWMLWWLRAKNCKAGVFDGPKFIFYILHVIFCIFFTPFYLGLISFFIGFCNHGKIHNDANIMIKIISISIYCFFFGLLMFPYILILMPIMILILIPGIFYHRYYIYIFTAYNAAVLLPDTGVNLCALFR